MWEQKHNGTQFSEFQGSSVHPDRVNVSVAVLTTGNPHDQESVSCISGAGIWRMQSPGTPFPGLTAAIAAVRTSRPDRPDLQALAWTLLPRLPGKPRTSANLKGDGACSRLNPLEDVILSDPWLGMNTEHAVNVMWAETDIPGLAERVTVLRAAGVPIRWKACGENDTGHVGIPMAAPVVDGIRIPGQDRAMLRKQSLTRSLFTTAINGDHSAGLRGMTKNPFHPRWDVEVFDERPATLDEILIPLQALAEAEGWKPPRRRYRNDRRREPSPEGRNCALFDLTRWWAADEAEKDGAAILDKAQEINATFANPLGYGEVASLARGITRFMNSRYDGRGRRIPLAATVVQARQAVAGRQTAAARAASRDEKLGKAVERIRARGDVPGQEDVAAEATVSLRTVQRAWTSLWPMIVNIPPYAPPVSDSSAVDTPSCAVPAILPPVEKAVSVMPEHSTVLCPPPPAILHPVRKPVAVNLYATLVAYERMDLAGRVKFLRKRSSEVVSLRAFLNEAAKRLEQKEEPERWSPEGVKRQRRLDSIQRCGERNAWHELAASQGLQAYRDAFAARYAALFRERRAAMERFFEPVVSQPDADPREIIKTHERRSEKLRITRMGWSAKFKAEDRLSRMWDDRLQMTGGQGHRGTVGKPGTRMFRTTPDAMDRMAMMIPDAPERPGARSI